MSALTDVSNARPQLGNYDYSGKTRIWLQCDARLWNQPKQALLNNFYVDTYYPYQCCGLRSMAGMNHLKTCPEFQTVEFLKLLAEQLNRLHRGGNISFVLNTTQRRALVTVLENMDKIGQGLSSPVKFRNFNMNNYNYHYIWTYRGRKARTANERNMVV